jgi:uncharacterized alkaline shock family protein YloU
MIGNQPRPNGPTSAGERDDGADAPGGAGAAVGPAGGAGAAVGPAGGAGAAAGAHTASIDPAGTAPGPAPAPWRPGPSPVAATGAPPTIAPPPASVAPARATAVGGTDVAARTVEGRIHIADEVVEKVAGLAATEVAGVADLGGDMERAMESVRERIGIGNKRGDQGVKAEVNGDEVVVSVTIMVEFGHVVLDVARRVQANVARQTERMLGLRVLEVNVTVDDVRTAPDPE